LIAFSATCRNTGQGALAIRRLLLLVGLWTAVQGTLYASVGPVPFATAEKSAFGAVRYKWIPPAAASVNSLGEIDVTGISQGGDVPLLRPSIHGRSGALVCVSATWDSSGRQLEITYSTGNASMHLRVQLVTNGADLEATLDADQPVVTSVDFGPWSSALQAQPIPVPYYSGKAWYLPGLAAFSNAWWDWHTTRATRLNGTAAQYLSRTDSTLSPLHERLSVVVSPDVDAVLPSPGNPPSPYIAELSGRMVLDIWNEDFQEIEQGFATLGDYGVTDCAGIIHIWQHAGYDNGLPQHYPANQAMGGDAGLVAAMKAGKADGCLMALHENYVDYYPNYAKFDSSAIALDGNGKRMGSWLNHRTGIQSYSTKPAWMAKDASTQSPEIHLRYGTAAVYVDVNSAAPPSSHGDMDAHAPGGGTLAAWLAGDTALWSYERKAHAGPVFGEGGDHWYYSGLLDGVEAQLESGDVLKYPGSQAPLFVDFDLKRIHPLQVNHGMGYYERWVAAGETITDTITMDAYRMQEIAFGHAPFLGRRYWNDVEHALVESNLVGPVAKTYGPASVSSIEYQVNGAWETPSVAARAGTFSRLRVSYGNGLTIVANASPSPLQWGKIDLPQYGWAAVGKGLLAYTAMCGSMVCDYAETPTSIFANARNLTDAQNSAGYAMPAVANVKQGSGRSFAITLNWKAEKAIDTNYRVFVHFVHDADLARNDGIVFQGDNTLAEPTSQWVPGNVVTEGPVTVQVPSSVPDGSYSVRVGLFDPRTGERVPLAGTDDGTMRYIVGYLTVAATGTHIAFKTFHKADPRMNATGTVTDFGTVRTDGMVSIRQENGQWILRPFPRSRKFTVELQRAKFPMPPSVLAEESAGERIKPLSDGAYWSVPLTGAKVYSWPAGR
jgi:hypothetical protein